MDIKVGTLHNKSASIEAGKNMHIQAGTIYNTNEHFATEVRTVQDEQLVEYQGSGSPHRYSAKENDYTLDDKTIWPNGKRPDYDVYIFNDESLYLHTPEGDHGAVRYVYDDGSSVEVHFGKYSGLQMPIGDGVILQANSDQYIQSEIDKGRARVITVISDANALKTMVNNTNSYMSELRNEYIGKDAIDKAKIRKDVYDRQKTDAILVYKGDAGTFSKYNAFLEPHCITFVTDVLKGTGHAKASRCLCSVEG